MSVRRAAPAPDPAAASRPDAAALLAEAREARKGAYAPYSGFNVGAALLTASGAVYRAANVENASYGLSSCAERVAVGAAVSNGDREFRAIAIAGPPEAGACMPCGSCRQILHEFAPALLVIVSDENGDPRSLSLPALLPDAFGPRTLAAAEDSTE